MVSIWMAAFEVGINALAFAGNNYALSKTGSGDAEVNCKGHDLAEGKLQEGNVNEMKIKWGDLNGWVLSSICETNITLICWISLSDF